MESRDEPPCYRRYRPQGDCSRTVAVAGGKKATIFVASKECDNGAGVDDPSRYGAGRVDDVFHCGGLTTLLGRENGGGGDVGPVLRKTTLSADKNATSPSLDRFWWCCSRWKSGATSMERMNARRRVCRLCR